MTIKISGVLAGVAALLAATSATASAMTDGGRYEWRPGVQTPGPRAPIAAPRRVWVPSMMASNTGACDRMMGARANAEGMPCCENHHS
jgi:hypothetical protein